MPEATLWQSIVIVVLGLACLATWLELRRLRRRARNLVAREARIEAQQTVADERAALAESRVRQAFEEGMRKALDNQDHDRKTAAEEAYRMGFEKGLLQGELNAETNFHVEYWTEVKKNQGYFFTTAEVVACYQLMYKQIPLGSPQRFAVDQSETVDKQALESMFHHVLGNGTPLADAKQSFGRLQLVSRDEPTAVKKSGEK